MSTSDIVETIPVARVAARFSSRDGLSHAEVRAVLQKLYELRALTVALNGNSTH